MCFHFSVCQRGLKANSGCRLLPVVVLQGFRIVQTVKCLNVGFCPFSIETDKLTKEEEDIYKLRQDFQRTVISQQPVTQFNEVC